MALAALLVGTAGWSVPAEAATIEAQAVALSTSATCWLGDIEVTYAGSGLERQITTFTAEDGTVLDTYDVAAFAPEHQGREYILSQADGARPAPGTIVAVHVTIGTSPPGPDTGEFFLAYRCDSRPNAQGGANQVLYSCTGSFGTCPTSVRDWRGNGAVPVRANPSFTG